MGGQWKQWSGYSSRPRQKKNSAGGAYTVCQCGQWIYKWRKAVCCDVCGKAWEHAEQEADPPKDQPDDEAAKPLAAATAKDINDEKKA